MTLLSAPLRPSRDEGRELLERELENPDYQREFGGPLRGMFDALVGWLEDNLGTVGGVTVPWGPVVLAGLLIAGIVVVILMVRPRLQPAAAAPEELLDADRGLSAAALRERAEDQLRAGQPDEAYRDLFRAVVRSTEERGILPEQAGRTATEAAFAVAGVFPGQATSLHQCAELFNLSRYGGGSVTEQDCRRLAELDGTLSRAEPSGPAEGQPHTPQVVVPR